MLLIFYCVKLQNFIQFRKSETLDINNVIALIYKSNYIPDQKYKIIKALNDNINTAHYIIMAKLFFSFTLEEL